MHPAAGHVFNPELTSALGLLLINVANCVHSYMNGYNQRDQLSNRVEMMNASGMLCSVRRCPLAGRSIRSRSSRPVLASIHTLSRSYQKAVPTYPPRPKQRPVVARAFSTSTSVSGPTTSDEMAEPTGLIAKSGIELLTFG